MSYTSEQQVHVNRIKQLGSCELLGHVDRAIELNDLWLNDPMTDRDPPREHPMSGWVRADTVGEVVIFGTTQHEAWIDYLAELGYGKPRTEWTDPVRDGKAWLKVPTSKKDEVYKGFTDRYSAFYALQAITAALVRLRRSTGWVENKKEWYSWRPTPEGFEILDGIELDLEPEQLELGIF